MRARCLVGVVLVRRCCRSHTLFDLWLGCFEALQTRTFLVYFVGRQGRHWVVGCFANTCWICTSRMWQFSWESSAPKIFRWVRWLFSFFFIGKYEGVVYFDGKLHTVFLRLFYGAFRFWVVIPSSSPFLPSFCCIFVQNERFEGFHVIHVGPVLTPCNKSTRTRELSSSSWTWKHNIRGGP